MIIFSAHKKTLLLLAFGLLFLFIVPAFLEKLNGAFVQHNAFLEQQKALLERDLHRSKLNSSFEEAEDVLPTPEEQELLLAPTDRTAVLERLEKSVLGYNITNLSVQLSAEQQAPDAPGLSDVTMSQMAISGDAPSDVYVQKYLQHATSVMAGRLQMKSLTLKRLSSNSVGLTNLHFEAIFDWTSNKAMREEGS